MVLTAATAWTFAALIFLGTEIINLLMCPKNSRFVPSTSLKRVTLKMIRPFLLSLYDWYRTNRKPRRDLSYTMEGSEVDMLWPNHAALIQVTGACKIQCFLPWWTESREQRLLKSTQIGCVGSRIRWNVVPRRPVFSKRGSLDESIEPLIAGIPRREVRPFLLRIFKNMVELKSADWCPFSDFLP
jgi:hypothetical protein